MEKILSLFAVVGLRQHPVSTSMASSSNSNLPPEVISQLLATGHLVREDGESQSLNSYLSLSLKKIFSYF